MSGRQSADTLFKEIHKKYDDEVIDNAFDVKWEVQRIDDDKISENVNFEQPESEEDFRDQLLNQKPILDILLNQRLKYLKKISKKEKANGYLGFDNIRIEDIKLDYLNKEKQIFFDQGLSKNIEDCSYTIKENKIIFNITGSEGMDKLYFSINDNDEFIISEIRKIARENNSGGLK